MEKSFKLGTAVLALTLGLTGAALAATSGVVSMQRASISHVSNSVFNNSGLALTSDVVTKKETSTTDTQEAQEAQETQSSTETKETRESHTRSSEEGTRTVSRSESVDGERTHRSAGRTATHTETQQPKSSPGFFGSI